MESEWETKYVCHFFFGPNNFMHRAESNNGLFDFLGGFWVDMNIEFTKGSNCKYFIPANRIIFIEKIKNTKGD